MDSVLRSRLPNPGNRHGLVISRKSYCSDPPLRGVRLKKDFKSFATVRQPKGGLAP